jgi:peptidase M28-like protein
MAPSLPPVRRRRRPRRGSLERPVDGRLYRAALLVVALPLLLATFTIRQPVPLQAPTLPPTFDARTTVRLAVNLANTYPDRTPGGSGALGAASWFQTELQLYGLRTHTDAWDETVPGLGRVQLRNLWVKVDGASPDVIVVMAHRDDTGVGPSANDNASGTAALVELTRAFARPVAPIQGAVESAHTLVFLSTDGGSFGGLGAARFARTWPFRDRIVAVLNLDALAGPGPARLEITGDTPRSPAPSLVATVVHRILDSGGVWPRHSGFFGQLVDLGFPFTLYEQGPFLAQGVSAVTLTTGDNRPPQAFGDTAQQLRAKTLGLLGQSAQEILGSLDQGLELAQGTSSYVWVGNRIIQGWAIELVLIALLVPYLVGAVDLFAYCRRRHIALAPALRALLSRLGFWLFVGLAYAAFRGLGAWPSGPARPPNPASATAGDWPVMALIALLLVIAAGWLVERHRLVPRRRHTSSEEALAGHAVALLALGVIGLLVAATNPFALLFVLPALHAWLWLPLLRAARPPVRLVLFAAGLAGPLIVLGSLAWRFGLGFDAPWYLLELVGVGYVATFPVAIALAGAAAAGQLAAGAAGRYAPYPAPHERRRGPIREVIRAVVLTTRARRRVARSRGI